MYRKLNVITPLATPSYDNDVDIPKASLSFENNVAVPAKTQNCEWVVNLPTSSSNCGSNLEVFTISPKYENSISISAMSPNSENKDPKRENPVFRSILFIALIIGVPLSPSVIFSEKRKRLVSFLEKWNRSVFFIRTIFFAIESIHNHLFWPSLALRYSYQVNCLTGYILTLIFFFKRREVETALKTMASLSSDWNPVGVKWLLVMYESVCLSFCVSYYSLGTYCVFYTIWDVSLDKTTSFSCLQEGSAFAYLYNWIVTFAVITTFHVGSATLFTTTILCSRYYLLSGEFISLFGRKTEKEASVASLGAAYVSGSLNLFKNIFHGIESVDDAFSVCAFVIYVDVINGFYVTLSLLLSGQEQYRTAEVVSIMLMLCLSSSFKFLYLTLSADTLAREHFALKNSLIIVSDSVVKKSSTLGCHMFSILSANIRTVDIHATGMGLFKITRVIIPSSISVMITYGVTIYQIGATADLDT